MQSEQSEQSGGRVPPVVDLGDLASGDSAREAAAAEAVRVGFGEYGLVYVRSHGIDRAVLDRFYDAFLAFCERPEEEKRRLSMDRIWYQRGWTPPNTERAVVAGGQPDFKECFFAAPVDVDPVCKAQYPQLYADNVWPEDAGAFRDDYLAIGRQLHEVGMRLLRGCARALDLPAETFEERCTGGPQVTRALKYLPVTKAQLDQGVLWGEEHTDFNLLTLLPGGRFLDPAGRPCPRPNDGSGLYLRTRPTPDAPKGELVPGRPPEGCIVAQVGQQLEILTGGTYLATPHVITAPETPGYSRTSMAHFIHCHSHSVLHPLPAFQNAETVRAYSPPVLAGTYSIKTLVDIGLAPASAIDDLGYRHYDRLASIRG